MGASILSFWTGKESLWATPWLIGDPRTEGMDAVAAQKISPEELYARTGIQKQIFNTIYQFLALQKEAPDRLAKGRSGC